MSYSSSWRIEFNQPQDFEVTILLFCLLYCGVEVDSYGDIVWCLIWELSLFHGSGLALAMMIKPDSSVKEVVDWISRKKLPIFGISLQNFFFFYLRSCDVYQKIVTKRSGKTWEFPDYLEAIEVKHFVISPASEVASFSYNHRGALSQVLLDIANSNYELYIH